MVDCTSAWQDFTDEIRAVGARIFLEVFAGKAVLTSAFKDAGWTTGPAVDLALGEHYDVRNHFSWPC